MKLNLNKTPEDIEKEKAAKQREIEADIQQRNHERQEKIQALHKVQTRNKIIIITVFVILFISMMTFGIYNIFVKQPMSPEEVQYIAQNQINYFPTNGVEGYLTKNIENMFNKYGRFDKENFSSMKIDTDSLYVSKISTISNTVAIVDFSVDISITEKDREVTNKEEIENLQKQGFKDTRYEQTTEQVTEQQVVPQPTETTEEITENTTEEQTEEEQFESDGSWSLVDGEGNTTMTADIPKDPGETEKEESTQPTVKPSPLNTDNTTEETSTEDVTEKTSDDNTTEEITSENETTEEVTKTPTTEEITTEKTTEEIKIQPETIKQKQQNEIKEYYIEGGRIYEIGKTTTKKYEFTVTLEYYKDEETGGNGYRLGTELSLKTFNRIDQTDFTKITVNDNFAFDPDTLLGEDVSNAVQIKVDKTLGDLYSGRDTSQDFFNTYSFNTFDAEYIGIDSFAVYGQANALGFNAYVTYSVKLNGFTYQINAYLIVEESGSSYIIKGYL